MHRTYTTTTCHLHIESRLSLRLSALYVVYKKSFPFCNQKNTYSSLGFYRKRLADLLRILSKSATIILTRDQHHQICHHGARQRRRRRVYPVLLVRDDVHRRRVPDRRPRVTHARAVFQRDVVSLDVENQRRGVGERRVRVGVYHGERDQASVFGDAERERSGAFAGPDARGSHGDVSGDDHLPRGVQFEIRVVIRQLVILESVSRAV